MLKQKHVFYIHNFLYLQILHSLVEGYESMKPFAAVRLRDKSIVIKIQAVK